MPPAVLLLHGSYSSLLLSLSIAMLVYSNEGMEVASESIGWQTLNIFEGEKSYLPCEMKENSSTSMESDERRIIWNYSSDTTFHKTKSFFFFKPETRLPAFENEDTRIFTEGGEKIGVECSFPFFTYNNATSRNETHIMCEESGKDDKRCWCSTQRFFYNPSDWGFCPCPYPMPGIKLYAEYGTDPGMPCVFPFHYKNKVYKECTREHDANNKCWCATTKYRDDRENNKFGYCPCAGPPNIGEWTKWGEWKDSRCGQITYRTRLCKQPKGVLSQVGLGRKLHCYGSSFEFKLFECHSTSNSAEDLHTASLQKRTIGIPKTREDHSGYGIVINNVSVMDSALYLCKVTREHLKTTAEQHLNPSHILTLILLNVQVKSKVKIAFLGHGTRMPDTATLYRGYRISYKWDAWSRCNRCGSWAGEMRRGGYCYTRDVRGKIDLPCNSMILTTRQRSVVGKLPNYLVYKTCREVCIKEKTSFIKVVPRMVAPSRPHVDRQLVVLNDGDSVRLDCDTSHGEFPSWRYDHPTGNLSTPIRYTGGTNIFNVCLDILGRLAISNAQDNHAGYYSCFIDRRLRRSFRILVEKDLKSLEASVEERPPYLRLAIIALIFLMIAIKVATTSSTRYR